MIVSDRHNLLLSLSFDSLMPALRRDWRLLFSTQSHGESFHTMTKMIMHQGPSIIIVRDTDGNMFGGFASHSWTCNAQFTGALFRSAKQRQTAVTAHLKIKQSLLFAFDI